MKYDNGALEAAVNTMLGDARPGLAAQAGAEPVMTTPATVVTTPEDVALVTASLNATAAVVNALNNG
ncbi:hypothetical protein [Flexivirga meconopsidis]|uniref:hypothetical protein n=1 Tax=Flexivirga meconopsidis TaxID=2977121 RepID=UPI00223F9F1F|nr:hypothetical protein [Flexivirga meconopsidis]